jgi:hypothetical protein
LCGADDLQQERGCSSASSNVSTWPARVGGAKGHIIAREGENFGCKLTQTDKHVMFE